MEKSKLKNIVVSVIVYGILLALVDWLIAFHKDPWGFIVVIAIFAMPTILRAFSCVESIVSALVASILIVFFTGAIYGSLGIATFVVAFVIAPVVIRIWTRDLFLSLVISIFGTYAIWGIYETAAHWEKYSTFLTVWAIILYGICWIYVLFTGEGGHKEYRRVSDLVYVIYSKGGLRDKEYGDLPITTEQRLMNLLMPFLNWPLSLPLIYVVVGTLVLAIHVMWDAPMLLKILILGMAAAFILPFIDAIIAKRRMKKLESEEKIQK